MAAIVNLDIKAGETFTRAFLWKRTDGSRRPLTGLQAKMQIRPHVGGPVLVELSSEDGNISLETTQIEGNATGVFTVVVPGALTLGVKREQAVYDIRFTTNAAPDGEPSYCPVEGTVTFDLAVTR